MTPNYYELNVYNNGRDWIIAYSVDDAIQVYLEHFGELPENLEYYPFVYLDPLLDVTIIDNNMEWISEEDRRKHKLPHKQLSCTATAREWIRTRGRGFLCSTEW